MDKSAPSLSEFVAFSQRVYDLDTVKKAAYRFLDRFSTDFQVDGDQILCVLTFSPLTARDVIEAAIADFKKEVLDQDLRRSVAAETAAYRNAILALAFAPSKLQDDE